MVNLQADSEARKPDAEAGTTCYATMMDSWVGSELRKLDIKVMASRARCAPMMKGAETVKGEVGPPHPGQKKAESEERRQWGGRVRVGIREGGEKQEMEEWTSRGARTQARVWLTRVFQLGR